MKKVMSRLQSEIDAAVEMLNVGGKKIKGFVTNTHCGRAYRIQMSISVPLWAYNQGTDYFLYYTAHEISHLYSPERGHNYLFYRRFMKICPKEFQHFELGYKKRNAAQAGITQKEATNESQINSHI
jgi:hypothetical protein